MSSREEQWELTRFQRIFLDELNKNIHERVQELWMTMMPEVYARQHVTTQQIIDEEAIMRGSVRRLEPERRRMAAYHRAEIIRIAEAKEQKETEEQDERDWEIMHGDDPAGGTIQQNGSKVGARKPARPKSGHRARPASESDGEDSDEETVIVDSGNGHRRKPPVSGLKGKGGRGAPCPNTRRTLGARTATIPTTKRKFESTSPEVEEPARPIKRTKTPGLRSGRPENNRRSTASGGEDADYTPQPASETHEEKASHKRGEMGKKRDDGSVCSSATNKFGWRLGRYFRTHLEGHLQNQTAAILDRDIFAEGRRIMSRGDETDSLSAAEEQLLRNQKYTQDRQRQNYRVVKHQTGLAMAIYCEHNIRLLEQAAINGQKELGLSWRKATIQLFIDKDTSRFSKVFEAWENMQLFPAMFIDGKVSDAMKDFVGAETRRRLYEAFIAWEDQDRISQGGIKVLIKRGV